MIIVTGGAGFIGSSLVAALNNIGRQDILVVDNLKNGKKFHNLVSCQIIDYLDKEDFLAKIKAGEEFSSPIEVVFHQGACSTTTEWDGQYMMRNNYEYSKVLLHYCLARKIPFIYASSAAIYGLSADFREIPENERPLNVYGYSKALFDQYVRLLAKDKSAINSPVIGLRYFNVYGPNEEHKGSMASVVLHFSKQLQSSDVIKLFAASHGYAPGEQERDFVYVSDVAKVNLWCFQNIKKKGAHILNVGTGRKRSFNDLAQNTLAWYKRGKVEYVPFPPSLLSSYQSCTEANLDSLRAVGFVDKFKSIEAGVKEYLDWLNRR